MSERPHGYARYVLDKCRCYACGWARSEYYRRREQLIARGKWQPYVDPAESRAHLAALRAAGLGTRQIAALAGLNRKALQDVASGVTQRMRPPTVAALLALPLDSALADHATIDGTGTCRRVQALAAMGWSLTRQAQQLGASVRNFRRFTFRNNVYQHSAVRIAALYDAWSMRSPEDAAERERARRFAARRCWFPPLAWDDETIDDPDALPCLLPPVEPVDRDVELAVQHRAAGHQVGVTSPVRWELIRRTPERSIADVAELAKCTRQYVSSVRGQLERVAA